MARAGTRGLETGEIVRRGGGDGDGDGEDESEREGTVYEGGRGVQDADVFFDRDAVVGGFGSGKDLTLETLVGEGDGVT